MFLPLAVRAESVGEDVHLYIGTWKVKLFFETAILLASWMDECARDAKEWATDSARFFKGVGTLHDASAKDWLNIGQPNDPRHVYTVNKDLLKKHEIEVRHEGAMVVLNAKNTTATMPYGAALQIAQFIRVKAKESQQRAGDLDRHWSKVKHEHEAHAGPGVTRG